MALGPGWAWEFCPAWKVRKGDTRAVGGEAEGGAEMGTLHL